MRSPNIQYAQSSDGTRIACYTAGRGTPIVLAPTPTGHIQAEWQTPQLRGGVAALAEHHRVIRYDRRGAGLSDRDVQDFGLASRLSDLTAVLSKLRLARFVLVCQPHSLTEAVTFAVLHPERVVRLILMSSSLDGGTYRLSPRFRYAQQSIAEDWETASLSLAAVLGGWKDPEQIQSLAAIIWDAVTPQSLGAFFAESVQKDVTDLLERLTMPALVIQPCDGPFFTLADANHMTSRIPEAHLVVVDSHASPLLGDATAAVAAIESFLSNLDVRLVSAVLENTDIADWLFISLNTVARHLTHIYTKTGTSNRVQATPHAIDHGLTE